MLWALAVMALMVVVYCFFVISGENVYRVTYHDPGGKKWDVMVSASDPRGAIRTVEKAAGTDIDVVKVTEEL